jgi:hypothetical protein
MEVTRVSFNASAALAEASELRRALSVRTRALQESTAGSAVVSASAGALRAQLEARWAQRVRSERLLRLAAEEEADRLRHEVDAAGGLTRSVRMYAASYHRSVGALGPVEKLDDILAMRDLSESHVEMPRVVAAPLDPSPTSAESTVGDCEPETMEEEEASLKGTETPVRSLSVRITEL